MPTRAPPTARAAPWPAARIPPSGNLSITYHGILLPIETSLSYLRPRKRKESDDSAGLAGLIRILSIELYSVCDESGLLKTCCCQFVSRQVLNPAAAHALAPGEAAKPRSRAELWDLVGDPLKVWQLLMSGCLLSETAVYAEPVHANSRSWCNVC